MDWQSAMVVAERILDSGKLPPSEEIITLIKKTNPTTRGLPEELHEKGYVVKSRLQNLLLKNYGASFYLTPHPLDPDIVLIRHRFLPSIDACHMPVDLLSSEAADQLGESPTPAPETTPRRGSPKGKGAALSTGSSAPADLLKIGRKRCDDYDFEEATDAILSIRIAKTKDLPCLLEGARILLDEIGSYDAVLELLLSQSRQVLKNERARELLALAYYHNGKYPEARAVFETLPPPELGKEALCAYARIACIDGELSLAFSLLNHADQKEGFVVSYVALRCEVNDALKGLAEPFLQRAREACERGDIDKARELARKALDLFPAFQEARQLIRSIEQMGSESEKAGLWNELDRAECSNRRMELLERLLTLDPVQEEKINVLIEKEKSLLRRKEAARRAGSLAVLAEQAGWAESFDILWWLLRQEDAVDEHAAVFECSPFFKVLRHNKRLHKLAPHKAKQLWLSYIELITAGMPDEELLDELRPYFKGYPGFDAKSKELSERELDRKRREVESLMERFSVGPCNMAEAESIYAELRKRASLIEAERWDRFREYAENRIEELRPRVDEKELLEKYREALYVGDNETADQIKEQITERGSLLAVEEEVAADFRITVQPLSVETGEQVAVAWDCGREDGTYSFLGAAQHEALLWDRASSIIVVDLVKMEATKYTSPHFRKPILLDWHSARKEYLFYSTGRALWRTHLSREGAHCVARIIPEERFRSFSEQDHLVDVFMSGRKESDYYYFLVRSIKKAKWSAKVVWLDLFKRQVKKVHHAIVEKERIALLKLSDSRSSFIMEMGKFATQVGETLGCRRVSQVTDVIAVNREAEQFYGLSSAGVFCYDSRANGMLWGEKILPATFGRAEGFCPVAKSALYRTEKMFLFYNYKETKLSEAVNKTICTAAPSTFFYCEYAPDANTLRLRDLTDQLEQLVSWKSVTELRDTNAFQDL